MATTYIVQTVASDGTVTDIATKSAKPAAMAAMVKAAQDGKTAAQVSTNAGTVVETISAPGTRAKPYTRIESSTFELGEGVELPEGYEVAYSRGRINTLVLRAGKGDYLVFNTQTGDAQATTGTKDSRILTSQLARDAKAAKAKVRDAEKARKAQAKLDKAAAKEAASKELVSA